MRVRHPIVFEYANVRVCTHVSYLRTKYVTVLRTVLRSVYDGRNTEQYYCKRTVRVPLYSATNV